MSERVDIQAILADPALRAELLALTRDIGPDGTHIPNISDHCDWARRHIAMSFGEINCLPHGTDEDTELLIVAQSRLAEARRALDAWQEAHDPMYTREIR